MIISLLGYMGSGKSHVSKILSEKLGFRLIDLDFAIAEKHQESLTEIFRKKGEIFFRKEEKLVLEEMLKNEDSLVLSLGGGTPVYYNNMDVINEKSTSVFLRTSVPVLANRLLTEKEKRPLISRITDDELPEFIAKHLFERNPFYSKAQITIDTDGKTTTEIADEIISALHL